ncbi:MAG: hypothetical protein DRO89_00020 [Candidatus Altiarchaeales archaeon]|nr:MAG: hypothetical protein DRO89_00020 [Candidatus Altiarchaeales archaeon]
MKKKLPKIKKEVCCFLSDESGRISKKSLIAISSVIGGIAISGLFSGAIRSVKADGPYGIRATCNHTNNIGADYDPTSCTIKVTHNLSLNKHYNSGVHMISGCTHTNNCDATDPCNP